MKPNAPAPTPPLVCRSGRDYPGFCRRVARRLIRGLGLNRDRRSSSALQGCWRAAAITLVNAATRPAEERSFWALITRSDSHFGPAIQAAWHQTANHHACSPCPSPEAALFGGSVAALTSVIARQPPTSLQGRRNRRSRSARGPDEPVSDTGGKSQGNPRPLRQTSGGVGAGAWGFIL